MTEKKLDCVILGLLSHEDLTGYEIKHRMDSALSFFWGASYGSIYPTLGALVKDGFADKRTDGGGRNKIIYTITDEGREHLKKWLNDTDNRNEIRYETLLKIFFGSNAGEKITAEHIRSFKADAEQNIARLMKAEENLLAAPDDDGSHRYYLMTLRFGLMTYRAYSEYCDEMLKEFGE